MYSSSIISSGKLFMFICLLFGVPNDLVLYQSEGLAYTSNSNEIASAKSALQLRSKRSATAKVQSSSWEKVAVRKVDDLLEGFIGIRDEDLASHLIDVWKHTKNSSAFASSVEEQFPEFEFPDDFIFDIWQIIGDARAGRV